MQAADRWSEGGCRQVAVSHALCHALCHALAGVTLAGVTLALAGLDQVYAWSLKALAGVGKGP